MRCFFFFLRVLGEEECDARVFFGQIASLLWRRVITYTLVRRNVQALLLLTDVESRREPVLVRPTHFFQVFFTRLSHFLCSISATTEEGPIKNQIANALVQRILQAATDGQKFKVVVVIPEVPGFAGNIKDESSVKTIMAAQSRTINRGGHSIYE